nr:hypothetical protein [Tanacetum cinerariifolium]
MAVIKLSKVSFSTSTGGIYGKVGVNTFRNAIGSHYLPHSSEYVAPPSIDIMRPWFETIGYREAVPVEWTLKKSLLPPRNKNTSYDHLFGGKGASSIARQFEEKEASSTIKLEDLAKLVSNVQPSFKDLDLPKDDPVIIVDDSNEDEEDEIYTTTKDTSSQKHKLELKNKAEAEVALFKAQPSFSNVGHLNELLVKSLQIAFSKILSAHDFSRSLPTELKDLPSKFNELTEEVKGLKQQVYEWEIKLPGDLKEIPFKLEDFTKTVAVVQDKLKTLDALRGLLLNVTKALNKFAHVLDSVSSKVRDKSVPSAGQANTMPAEREKNKTKKPSPSFFKEELKRMMKRKT